MSVGAALRFLPPPLDLPVCSWSSGTSNLIVLVNFLAKGQLPRLSSTSVIFLLVGGSLLPPERSKSPLSSEVESSAVLSERFIPASLAFLDYFLPPFFPSPHSRCYSPSGLQFWNHRAEVSWLFRKRNPGLLIHWFLAIVLFAC